MTSITTVRIALPALALLLVAPSLTAQDAPAQNTPSQDAPAAPAGPPGARDVSRVTAGTYAADPAHTLVGWTVDHLGFNDYFGQFGDVSGTLTLDPAKLSDASVSITVPVAGLSTASSGLTTHMQSADFFDAANHPTVRFTSTAVTVTGEGTASIAGNLTIRGQTRPVTLAATFAGAGANPMNRKATVGFHATTTIQRSAFGMTYGVPMVADDVRLTISAAFEKTS